MIEIPEALVISDQINKHICGKQIVNVVAEHSSHKFAWYYGDPQNYNALLKGKTIDKANAYGGMLEIKACDSVILFAEGVRLRYHDKGEKFPKKHQLLIEFDDSSGISATIQMYGGLWCFEEGKFDNDYYEIAKNKPSPLSNEFDKEYFDTLISSSEVQKLSAKAFLATQQRIPGLGNGVLQDILYNSKIHPKRKINTLNSNEKENMFKSIKKTLQEMVLKGGRDTERDLFDCLGNYKTKVSKHTLNHNCPICGSIIKKTSYMGGSVYYCEGCQIN